MKKPAKKKVPKPVMLTCPACGTKHPVADARCDECNRTGRTDR